MWKLKWEVGQWVTLGLTHINRKKILTHFNLTLGLCGWVNKGLENGWVDWLSLGKYCQAYL